MQKSDTHLFYDATNNGLLFWEAEFAGQKIKKTSKGFSFDGGSCNVTLSDSGKYVYTNFKEFTKGFNPFSYIMLRDNVNFIDAKNTLFAQFNIGNAVEKAINLPIKKWTDSFEPVGKFDVVYKPEVLQQHIFAPFLTSEVCEKYGFFEIESFWKTQNVGGTNKVSKLAIQSTVDYPIFGYKTNEFVKIYEPKAIKDKSGYSSKHHFLGKKTQRHIYGWDRLATLVNEKDIEFWIENVKESSGQLKESSEESLQMVKLDYVFIATGGSDGLNLASLGYNVIWYNSETEIISEFELNYLLKIANNVVYIPDLDKTGIEMAKKMGLLSKKHLKIKMLFLPDALKLSSKKDFADWTRMQSNSTLESIQHNFLELLSQAKPFEFWDFNPKRNTYNINSGKLIQFLHFNGFYTYLIPQMDKKSKRAIEERIFIKITDNIIEKISGADVQNFVLDFVKKMFVPLAIQEVVYKSIFFGENNTLRTLPKTDINIDKSTAESQLYFFKNTILKVTKDAIEKISYSKNEVQIWNKNIIERHYSNKPKAINLTKKEDGSYDIEILNNDSKYLKLLINTSRFYWQKDADDVGNDKNPFGITSSKLTDGENQHQKNELINKIYCIGYLAHEYKIKQKSYFVIGTDHKIGASSKENNGGSGKSAVISGLYGLTPQHLERNGRELNKDTERFKYTDVDDELRLIHFDEMNPQFDLAKMFSDVTADVTCNWKGGKMVYVPFKYFCKIAITMNSVPQDITSSHSRRMLNFETSDFYHVKNDDFSETRQISDSFDGQTLWGDTYTQNDWSLDDNFILECLQFYLSESKKIEVDGQNLIKRSKIQKIGDKTYKYLKSVFDVYNTPDCKIIDIYNIQFKAQKSGYIWINKKLLYEHYKDELGKFAKTLQDFKDDLFLFFDEIQIEFAKQKEGGTGTSTPEHFRFLLQKKIVLPSIINDKTTLPDIDF